MHLLCYYQLISVIDKIVYFFSSPEWRRQRRESLRKEKLLNDCHKVVIDFNNSDIFSLISNKSI